MCSNCEYPNRILWSSYYHRKFENVAHGSWISLVRCVECGQLWCSSPYDDHQASHEFHVVWRYSQEDFQELCKIDYSLILHEWHGTVIKEEWIGLPDVERESIYNWRKRSGYYDNPIDETGMKEKKYIKKSSDIQKYIDKLVEN